MEIPKVNLNNLDFFIKLFIEKCRASLNSLLHFSEEENSLFEHNTNIIHS